MEQHLISDILYGPAIILGGSGLADPEVISAAVEEFSAQRFCVVRQWMLLDVLLPPEREEAIVASGLAGTALYAHVLVHDSTGYLKVGTPVLTGFERSLSDCFFESEQGLFILAGSGSRKSISLPAFLALGEHLKI
ncbi:hypothetical protein PPUJ20005_38270 [Pseudomonas putida]|uniref:DUF6957 family protein n=1 Tax=Pseudomonas putida TaxID=303 RepID=UPI00235CBCC0|nr:hypothetical protein [Pseudomonas putida]GLO09858.1 hypothetical protein PPUJ20005_38270 [Pseudomonas putida]HDS0987055.1 hypothetical protein [Pseudomonas putida]